MIKEQVFNTNISRKYFKIFSLRNYLIEFSNIMDKLSLVAKHALSVEIIEERVQTFKINCEDSRYHTQASKVCTKVYHLQSFFLNLKTVKKQKNILAYSYLFFNALYCKIETFLCT